MNELTVHIEGLAAAEAAFPEPAALKKVLGAAVAKGAQVYRRGIKSKAAGAFKDTTHTYRVKSGEMRTRKAGTLRGNIKYRRVTKMGGISAIAGPLTKGTKADPIAHLVESGHGGPHPAPAHPFVGPAFESYEEAAVAAAETVLFAAIDAL